MRFLRTVAVGAGVVGAAAGLGILGSGAASAVVVAPIPGGVQVELNHADTVWADQANIGATIASMPNVAAQSFGAGFDAATEIAAQLPQGRVGFTVVGPLSSPGGIIVILAE